MERCYYNWREKVECSIENAYPDGETKVGTGKKELNDRGNTISV